MRLGYSCHDSFPSSDTNTQQIFCTVLEVTRSGVAVDLVIPSIVSDAPGAIASYYGMAPGDMPPGFSFQPLGTRDARSALAKASFDWRAAGVLSRGGYDLVWTRDALAAVAAARAGLPFVFETYRPDFAAAPAFALWRRVCLTARGFRGVITHSRLTADAFARAGVPRARLLVAHNGFAPALMTPRLDRAEARARVGLPVDARLVLYAGHVGPEKGIDMLLRTVARVPDATLVILGVDEDSDEARWVAAQARAAGATRVMLRPRVPVSGVAPYLYAADCLIVPPTDAPLRRYGRTVLPMKIFSYLAAGRPIVAAETPDVAEVLVNRESALLVPAGNEEAAAAALTELLQNAALQERLAAGASAASRAYTWEARAKKLVEFFHRNL